MRIWFCEVCKSRNSYTDKLPAQELKACVFYGAYGRPPFSKGWNNGALIARFLYCDKCV